MSGTSLNGMDAALVRFDGPTHAHLLAFHSRPYTEAERGAITSVLAGADPRHVAHLHAQLGQWASEAVQGVLDAGHIRATELDLIAFPGQTIWHEPPRVTWQLGEPAILAEEFGVRVVSGFRGRDVAAGGQGAPLVPMADVLLFGATDHPRALLNVGGMANMSWVARRAEEAGAVAFDTGPGMALIDAVAGLVTPGATLDQDGALAARGTVNEAVLTDLLADPFFSAPPPKSTGRELFGASYARRLHERVPGPDGVATALALTVRSIAAACRQWLPDAPELLVSGGGVQHPGVMAGLVNELNGAAGGPTVRRFDELFFRGDAKECVAFALLGYLCVHGQPGNLPAATGARGPRVLGQITPA
jgi:anhydro-N-acetylmuramic acid kinase